MVEASIEIDPAVLARIGHLDLSGSMNLQEKRIVGWGSYGDIFRCRCTILGRGEVDVALKTLRFYVGIKAFMKVSTSLV